jgi:hypothetical protein
MVILTRRRFLAGCARISAWTAASAGPRRD